MTDSPAVPEALTKSLERVRDLGEVYTPSKIVTDMLDLLPESVWDANAPSTFLEPTCGNGNFLVEILQRKLQALDNAYLNDELDADTPTSFADDPDVDGGITTSGHRCAALQALSTIYGIDISEENVEDSRARMLEVMDSWCDANGYLTSPVELLATFIVDRNIVPGDFLAAAKGEPEDVLLVQYLWDAPSRHVAIRRTSLGSIKAEAKDDGTVVDVSGFQADWMGSVDDLYQAALMNPNDAIALAAERRAA